MISKHRYTKERYNEFCLGYLFVSMIFGIFMIPILGIFGAICFLGFSIVFNILLLMLAKGLPEEDMYKPPFMTEREWDENCDHSFGYIDSEGHTRCINCCMPLSLHNELKKIDEKMKF